MTVRILSVAAITLSLAATPASAQWMAGGQVGGLSDPEASGPPPADIAAMDCATLASEISAQVGSSIAVQQGVAKRQAAAKQTYDQTTRQVSGAAATIGALAAVPGGGIAATAVGRTVRPGIGAQMRAQTKANSEANTRANTQMLSGMERLAALHDESARRCENGDAGTAGQR